MSISYRKFDFTIEAREPMVLPVYKGSTFRGGFGNVFRRILCALKRKECDGCILKNTCIYSYVFETIPPGDADFMNMGKYERVPHPFIIEPPDEATREYRPGERVRFGLCLVGRAVELLPYFILTFEELGGIGLGKGRGKYALVDVTTAENGAVRTVYSSLEKIVSHVAPDTITLRESLGETPADGIDSGGDGMVRLCFATPARVIYQRRLVDRLEFHVLIRHLLRRLQLLRYFHCGKEAAEWDHRRFISDAENVQIAQDDLRWHDWERYSSRQRKRMKMGGLVGEISYRGKIGPFMAILRAGEIFHVGKGTSFGLGRYAIVAGCGPSGRVD